MACAADMHSYRRGSCSYRHGLHSWSVPGLQPSHQRVLLQSIPSTHTHAHQTYSCASRTPLLMRVHIHTHAIHTSATHTYIHTYNAHTRYTHLHVQASLLQCGRQQLLEPACHKRNCSHCVVPCRGSGLFWSQLSVLRVWLH